MAAATYVQSDFRGGVVSQTMQGRLDHPSYRTWMNVCVNGLPMEQGAWTRRPGSRFLGTTRGGAQGRVVTFDFQEASPYTMEFTDGHLRFRAGPALVTTNDPKTVIAISAATPAEVSLSDVHNWSIGDQVFFGDFGTSNIPLQGRMFSITVTSPSQFTITDALTGEAVDGSTLGTFASLNVFRALDISTPYIGGAWSSLRAIMSDVPNATGTTAGAVLLQRTITPYVLTVDTPPSGSQYATFNFEAINFKDGPYFDAVPGGTLATPSALIGNVNLTLSFNAYDAARSYAIGDYVVSSGVNYRSLTDANLNNTPAGSPTDWLPVSAADAIGPNGFVGTDIGRMVRLFSEPAIWASGTSYSAGNVVAYGGSGPRYDGAVTYWKALASSTGVVPGTDLTKWTLFPSGAIWTWGKIISLSNVIDRALAGSTSIGDLTQGGGLAAAFDGVLSQVAAASAEFTLFGGFYPANQTFTKFVGKDYSGASDQAVAQAIVYPSSDRGVASGIYVVEEGTAALLVSLVFNLRGSATPPATSSDGTLLGTTSSPTNLTSPVTIISSDQTTAWKYVWVEVTATLNAQLHNPTFGINEFYMAVAELSLFSPAGTGTSQGVQVQILGDALLYTTAVRTWRLGLYSNTTGWPTCGTYHEGRLWLSGVVANRIDSSKSNDIFNFAPTNPDGSVSGNNGISYTFNAPDINPIFWMVPSDLGIVCGTQGGEWLVQATSNNLPLTPTTIQAHRYTKYNCANVEPRRTDLTLAVVQAFRRELLEYFPDMYGRFAARDLAEHAKHLVETKIEEIAYQQETIPVIWARTGGNSGLIGCTYRRQSLSSVMPSDFNGWHTHSLGGGRFVESICTGGNIDGTLDALFMVTTDATGVRHVEMLTNFFTETMTLGESWFLDDAVKPTSVVSSTVEADGAPYGGMTLNGLWHLDGQTVQVTAAGVDCGEGEDGTISDFVVTDGSTFIPYGDGISAGTARGLFTPEFATAAVAAGQIVVGRIYLSAGMTVRPNSPQESGARNGPAFGKLRRSAQFFGLFQRTAGVTIGTSSDFTNLAPIKFNAPGSPQPMIFGQTFSGVFRSEVLGDDSFDAMLSWVIERPWPATIAAIGAEIQTKDI